MDAHEILSSGATHLKDRAAVYDNAEGERSIPNVVAAFIAITGDAKMDTAEKGWMFMVLLKLVRTQQGDFKLDNYEDAAAYCALMGEEASNGPRANAV